MLGSLLRVHWKMLMLRSLFSIVLIIIVLNEEYLFERVFM